MKQVRDAIEDFGRMLLFSLEAAQWTVRPPWRPELILVQMAAIGVGSVFIVVTTAFFIGMVLALQGNYAMRQFAAEGFVGGSVAISLVREIGPVFTALMVIGRCGSAISTEIGTMRVTEQIDAMETMAVNPIQYLVVPRVIASTVMMPVLTVVFDSVGYLGGYIMGILVANIPEGPFLEHTRTFVEPHDIVHGLGKAAIFGAVLGIIACWRGFAAAGGARGVGVGTTRGVVASSISILIVDYAFTLVSVGGGR